MKKVLSPEEMMKTHTAEVFKLGDRVREIGTGKLGYVRASSYGNLFQFEADDGEILQPHQLINVVPVKNDV